MRIYSRLVEAVDETERELLEMGFDVQSHSMQNIKTEGDDNFLTKELMGYVFRVNEIGINSQLELLKEKKLDIKWITAEFSERISQRSPNPGDAWQWRSEVWLPFMVQGRFEYTYGERINDQLSRVVKGLRNRPNSRQAIVQIYNADLDKDNWGGKKRIPCSMHYQFMIRDDAVHVIYTMRSSDLYTHFCYDVLMACKMASEIAGKFKGRYELGTGTFFFGSLHAFKKDLVAKGVF